jgi:hypothetical protein
MDIERPRGILSKKDREFLKDPEEYGGRAQKYQRREAIKKRLAHAFVDMAMLTD